MPAKNAERTIGNAIHSVLFAFPKDIEVIVWDDGSTDNTGKVASECGDKRIRVMRSETSLGGGVARQKIIDASDSEYLVNQDSDDISLPWRHAVQFSHMSTADFSFTAVFRFSKNNPLHQPSLPLSYSPRDAAYSLLFHNPFSHPSMLAKRSALADIGGYSTAWAAQDYELLLRAAANGKRIKRSGVPSLLYRLSATQISQQNDYVPRILANTDILNSYSLLLDTLLPNRPFAGTKPSSVYELRESVNSDQIHSLIDRFSPHLRPYYRNLQMSQRYGHVGAEILKQ